MTVTLKLPASANASRFTLALIGFLVLPLGVQAQRTPAVIVQPPTGWFGVRISDQAMIDDIGNAFFDSYPVVTGVDSSDLGINEVNSCNGKPDLGKLNRQWEPDISQSDDAHTSCAVRDLATECFKPRRGLERSSLRHRNDRLVIANQ